MPRSESPHASSAPCHSWQATGTCKYGDSCKFSHDVPAAPATDTTGGKKGGKKKKRGKKGKKGKKSKSKKEKKGKGKKSDSGSSRSSSSSRKSGGNTTPSASQVESLKGSAEAQTPKGSQSGR